MIAGVGSVLNLLVNLELLSIACGGVFAFLIFVVLPAVILKFYAQSSVQTTRPQSQLDRSLPLAGAWLGAGVRVPCVGSDFSFGPGHQPVFLQLLGLPAVAYLSVLIISTLFGAYLCYRMSIVVWAITVAVCALK